MRTITVAFWRPTPLVDDRVLMFIESDTGMMMMQPVEMPSGMVDSYMRIVVGMCEAVGAKLVVPSGSWARRFHKNVPRFAGVTEDRDEG